MKPSKVYYKRDIENNNRIVKYLFRRMEQDRVTIKAMAKKTGLAGGTISNWRYKTNPRMDHVEDCLNVLGFRLQVVKIDE